LGNDPQLLILVNLPPEGVAVSPLGWVEGQREYGSIEAMKRRPRLTLAVGVACCLGLLLSFSETATGTFPGKNGRIVFSGGPTQDPYDIWSIHDDGSRQRRVTSKRCKPRCDYYYDPAVSPNGKKIAFEGSFPGRQENEIYVMRVDGTHRHRITGSPEANQMPAFSPSGKKIAFVRRHRLEGIYTIRVDGTHERRLTSGGWNPAFSPNGRKIAFQRGGEIYVMRADGTKERRLTHGPALAANGGPSFSPDGEKIAFHGAPEDDFAGFEIYVMRVDGTDLRRLTKDTANDPSPPDDRFPAFSPNGKKIAFSSDRDYENVYKAAIYVMRADGTDQHRLTDHPGVQDHPDWAVRR
jgi:TolB protein